MELHALKLVHGVPDAVIAWALGEAVLTILLWEYGLEPPPPVQAERITELLQSLRAGRADLEDDAAGRRPH